MHRGVVGVIPGISGIIAGIKSKRFRSLISSASLDSGLGLCLDYADSLCYDGTQTLKDLSGNSYDFSNGGSTSDGTGDLTFTGTAGSLDSSSYMAQTAGNQYLRSIAAESAGPSWVRNAHKNGSLFTLAGWFYIASGSTGGTDVRNFFATYRVSQDATRGMGLFHQASNFHLMTDNTYLAFGGNVVESQWNFIACSFDDATGICHMRCNATTTQTTGINLTTTSTASAPLYIGSNSGGNATLQAGARHGAAFGWSRALSASEITALYEFTKERYQ